MEINDTIDGIMKTPTKKKPVRKARGLDNHYRVSPEEYEYLARKSHNLEMSIAEYTRYRLFPRHIKDELLDLRTQQRKAGDPNEWFTHPKLKKS